MAHGPLKMELQQLERAIIDTMLAGLKRHRSDLSYPESHSDMQACVRAMLRMFEVNRAALPIEIFPERAKPLPMAEESDT